MIAHRSIELDKTEKKKSSLFRRFFFLFSLYFKTENNNKCLLFITVSIIEIIL